MRKHHHDYFMEFDDRGESRLNFTLRCRCGDVAPDMDTALRRMDASRVLPRLGLGEGLVLGLAFWGALALLAMGAWHVAALVAGRGW